MPATTGVLTRQQYVRDKTVTHEDYFAQFVTEQTLHAIQNRFGIDRLSEAFAADRHLNAIPLASWERLAIREIDPYPFETVAPRPTSFVSAIPFNRDAAAAAGEAITRSTLVCITKSAARTLVAQHSQRRELVSTTA